MKTDGILFAVIGGLLIFIAIFLCAYDAVDLKTMFFYIVVMLGVIIIALGFIIAKLQKKDEKKDNQTEDEQNHKQK